MRPLFGLANYLTAGVSIDHSAIGFRSTSTLGRIFPDLDVAVDPALAGSGSIIHTNGNLGYAPVTSGRHHQLLRLLCRGCAGPDRCADPDGGLAHQCRRHRHPRPQRPGGRTERHHGYGHVNPLAGLTYKLSDAVTLFGGYSQANRAPTPLELDCASPTLPCLLEGSLVADPPLAQVVSHTYQAGLRGKLRLGDGKLDWSASLFRTDSDNDIVALASTIRAAAISPMCRPPGARAWT